MMKKSKSIRSGMLKVAVLVPLILISLGLAVGKVRQGDTVSGKIVFADTGEPAHGASVVVKNTTIGTVADEEGSYQLELKERAEVVFSFVGYRTQSYWFNPGEYRFVVLEREAINLIPPVIMIDGVKSDYSSPDEIDPDIIASIRSFDRFGKEGGKDMYMITTKKGKSAGLNNDRQITQVLFNGKSPWLVGLIEYMNSNMRKYDIEPEKLVGSGFEVSFFVTAEGKVSDLHYSVNDHPGLNMKEVAAFSMDLTRLIQSSELWTAPIVNGKPEGVKLFIRGNNWYSVRNLKRPDAKTDASEYEEVFFIVEEMPKFNNGDPALEFGRYIYDNLRYPDEEKEKRISGQVFVQFTVQVDGKVGDVKVVKGAGGGLDSEAVRVLESSPLWTPGKQRGKAVPVSFTFVVNFRLPQPDDQTALADSLRNIARATKWEPALFKGEPHARSFYRYIYENLDFIPDSDTKIHTSVATVNFNVQKDGSLSNIHVKPSNNEDFSKAIIKVVENSPLWTPQKRNGEPVELSLSMILRFPPATGTSQFRSDESDLKEEVFFIVEEMPKFNNGDAASEFRKYIAENLRYPKEEKEKGISGRVIVQFKVSDVGSVEDVRIVVGASPGLDNEALRVVESSPVWTPGKQKGEAVNVLFTFLVNFVIDGKEGKPATDRSLQVPKTNTAWRKVDQMAEYPGGMGEFRKFLAGNLRYPVYAYDNQVDGEVAIEVVVNENGKIVLLNEYTVPDEKQHDLFTQEPVLVVAHSRGVDKQNKPVSEMGKNALVQEVLRVLLSSPAWSKPAVKDGKPVAVVMRVPVKFILQDRGPSSQSGVPTTGLADGLSREAPSKDPGFLILVETFGDKIKLTGLKGCAWKELTFTPSIPYIDQNGVTMAPTIRDKSEDPNLSTFLFRLARIENKIELTGMQGTNWKNLSFSWRRGECRQLINQDGMVSGR